MERHEPKLAAQNSNKWTVFMLTATGIFMSTLDGSIVNIALPRIMAEFQTSLLVIEWVMLIYFLTVSSLLLGFGRLSDIKGRRWVYVRGLMVFTVGSLLCGTAQSPWWLIGARAFQGVGAAMVMACTPALISDIFPVRERGKALGMMGTVTAAGLTMGPFLGGWILEYFSWPYIFMINIPIGLVSAVASSYLLKGTKADVAAHEAFDWKGAALLIIGLGCFLFAVTRSHQFDTATLPVNLGLMLIAGIAFMALVRVEQRRPDPIIDLTLLNIRLFVLPLLSGLIMFAALFVMVFLMPFYLIYPLGFSMKQTGQAMMTPFVCLMLVSPVSGYLSDHIGSRYLCALGMFIQALALLSLSYLSAEASLGEIVLRLMLAGVGTAIFIAPNSSVVLTSVPLNRRGIAAAMLAAVRNLGMVLGVALAGGIFNAVFHALSQGAALTQYQPELTPAFMTAFRYAMISGAVIAAVGVVVAGLRGPEPKRK